MIRHNSAAASVIIAVLGAAIQATVEASTLGGVEALAQPYESSPCDNNNNIYILKRRSQPHPKLYFLKKKKKMSRVERPH